MRYSFFDIYGFYGFYHFFDFFFFFLILKFFWLFDFLIFTRLRPRFVQYKLQTNCKVTYIYQCNNNLETV